MGIQNLLPFVKKACRQGSISEFAGCSIAVDVSCLLHRGLFGCASDVAQGVTTDFYIRYVMKHVKTLIAIGCHVVLVFDGQPLPAKKDTNECRREKRNQQKRMGEQLLSEGKKSEAYECFKRSTTITPEIVENTIEAFQGMKMVDVLVAPYESDAQLAFLANTGKVQAVVTEDSDLIAFGCEKIIFKMDHSGSCLIYELKNLPKCLGKTLAENFDFSKFRRICILAGCDYLQSGLPGVGLSKAATFFAKTSGTNLYQILPRLPRYLNMSSLKIKKEFIEDFIRAENTFLYQIVFDPAERRQRPLNNYPQGDDGGGNFEEDDFVGVTMMDEKQTDYSYAGDLKPSTLALRLALGNRLDCGGPSLCDKFVLPSKIPEWSIWSPNFESGEIRKKKMMAKEMNKSECGAFMLSTGVRKIHKEFASNAMTSIIENEEITILGTSMASSEGGRSSSRSSEGDNDFVEASKPAACKAFASTATRNSNIESFFTSRQRSNPSGNSSSLSLKPSSAAEVKTSKTVSSFSTKRGNGVQQNWNCDDLLKLYALDSKTIVSDASPTSSQESSVISKRRAVSLESDSGCAEDSEEISVCEVKFASTAMSTENADEEKSVTVLSNADMSESFSRYFLNKGGVRTSGLSRRSVNPFKKAKLSTIEGIRPEPLNVSGEYDSERIDVASPLSNQHNPEGSAVRISGLRRAVSAKEVQFI